jgi:hypothetical protein
MAIGLTYFIPTNGEQWLKSMVARQSWVKVVYVKLALECGGA